MAKSPCGRLPMWEHHKIEKRKKKQKHWSGTFKVQSLVVKPWPNNMG